MYPELGSVGPLTIHSYGLTIALGVLFAIFLMIRKARRLGFPPSEKVIDLVFVVVFSGLMGARIFYVIQEWEWYRSHVGEIFQVWKGGLVYYGGMIASFLFLFIYLHAIRLPLLQTTDFLITYVPFVHALGRLGCFLNGCCYGKPSFLPWAVQFPSLQGTVHPTQLYESLFNLALFGLLLWYYPRRRFQGEMIILYLIIYSLGRFFIEFLRGDQMLSIFGYSFHQFLSLLFIGVGILSYGIHRLRRG